MEAARRELGRFAQALGQRAIDGIEELSAAQRSVPGAELERRGADGRRLKADVLHQAVTEQHDAKRLRSGRDHTASLVEEREGVLLARAAIGQPRRAGAENPLEGAELPRVQRPLGARKRGPDQHVTEVVITLDQTGHLAPEHHAPVV